jgi:hypothetical protein
VIASSVAIGIMIPVFYRMLQKMKLAKVGENTISDEDIFEEDE